MDLLKRPNYRLKVENWWEDGTKDEPEFYELTEIDGNLKLTRREFLAVTALLSALLSGCASLSPILSCKDIKAHKDSVNSVSFSPDGKLLASGSSDHTIKLWEVATGKLLKTLEGHKGSVYSVSFSPDGKLLASGSYDKTIKLWEVASGKLLKTLEGHKGLVKSVSFSPDGKLLASGSGDNTIKLWEVASGKLLKTLEGHKNYVISVSFSPDGKLLASGSWDHTIKLWDVASGKLLSSFFDPKATEKDCKGVTFKYVNEYGQVVTYTLPCGSPIPPGATCLCNCIPGTYVKPAPSVGGTYRYCTCVPVCVCIPVV